MNVNVNLPNGTPIAMNFEGVREKVPLPDGNTFVMNFLSKDQRDAYMGFHDELTAKEDEITGSLPNGFGYFLMHGSVISGNTQNLMEDWLTIAWRMAAHFDYKYSAVIPYWRQKWNDYEMILNKPVITTFPLDYKGDLPLATDFDVICRMNHFH